MDATMTYPNPCKWEIFRVLLPISLDDIVTMRLFLENVTKDRIFSLPYP